MEAGRNLQFVDTEFSIFILMKKNLLSQALKENKFFPFTVPPAQVLLQIPPSLISELVFLRVSSLALFLLHIFHWDDISLLCF